VTSVVKSHGPGHGPSKHGPECPCTRCGGFSPGNRATRNGDFYVRILTPLEIEEVADLAEAIRQLSPVYSDALEPLVQSLAGLLWRRRKAYARLEEKGVRPSEARLLADLGTLERTVLLHLRELGMTPKSAAELGLDLARIASLGRADGIDLNRLSPEKRNLLEALVEEASIP
jgi:hypothetical protein